VAGIEEMVAEHYLRKQKTELEWIRNAVRTWSFNLRSDLIAPDLLLVQKYWVENQARFFGQAFERDAQYHQRELKWTWGPVYVLGLITLAVLGYALVGGDLHRGHGIDLHGAAVVIMTSLVAIAGAVAAYGLKMAFNEQRKQYARMYNLYQRGAVCLAAALKSNDSVQARCIITELGKEALEENADWVFLHREREFELRVGG
jgi:hypothetical protein